MKPEAAETNPYTPMRVDGAPSQQETARPTINGMQPPVGPSGPTPGTTNEKSIDDLDVPDLGSASNASETNSTNTTGSNFTSVNSTSKATEKETEAEEGQSATIFEASKGWVGLSAANSLQPDWQLFWASASSVVVSILLA